MSAPASGKKSRRGGRGGLHIGGGVVPAGTIPSIQDPTVLALTREERGRRALLALGELVLKVREGRERSAATRPTRDVKERTWP